MRVLVVDDSPARQRLLTALLRQAGHDVVNAGDGAAALDLLARQAVDAVVSDVRMPRMDGFQLCRTLRADGRWKRLPFVFYSSIFIGDRAHELGMDLGATAYLDASHVPPERIAKEIAAVVQRVISAEYRETIVRLSDDVEFTRRYHQVLLSSLDTVRDAGVHGTISSNVDALDEILSRLDRERRNLAARSDVTVQASQLERLKKLSDDLGEQINAPLGVLLQAAGRSGERSAEASAAAAKVRAAIGHINELVRRLTKSSQGA
jgi:CheY-like chemotaxis protein